jgi:hypothetical protein
LLLRYEKRRDVARVIHTHYSENAVDGALSPMCDATACAGE